MNLRNKKALAAKVLGVGKNRVIFSNEGFEQIKEAITKQDIKTLYEEGLISIKPVSGRRAVEKRKRKKGPGKIKFKIKNRKRDYVILTRKLRAYLRELIFREMIDHKTYLDTRMRIKKRYFRSKENLKDYLKSIPMKGSEKIRKQEEKISNKKSPQQEAGVFFKPAIGTFHHQPNHSKLGGIKPNCSNKKTPELKRKKAKKNEKNI